MYLLTKFTISEPNCLTITSSMNYIGTVEELQRIQLKRKKLKNAHDITDSQSFSSN